jgi:hypothetical protein
MAVAPVCRRRHFENARYTASGGIQPQRGILVHQSTEAGEKYMSGINGDKARFNRRRRQKISRRLSNEKMLKVLAEKNLVAPAPQGAKEKLA